MKKKVLSVLLVSTMLAGVLAGCGSSDKPAAQSGSEQMKAQKQNQKRPTASPTGPCGRLPKRRQR